MNVLTIPKYMNNWIRIAITEIAKTRWYHVAFEKKGVGRNYLVKEFKLKLSYFCVYGKFDRQKVFFQFIFSYVNCVVHFVCALLSRTCAHFPRQNTFVHILRILSLSLLSFNFNFFSLSCRKTGLNPQWRSLTVPKR